MGVLVFGTLHTSSAAKTVGRIIDTFPAEQQVQARSTLADSLAAVVAQLLCRKIGGGRLGVHEILIRDKGLGGAIREGADHDDWKVAVLPTTERGEELEAVHHRHHQVQHDHGRTGDTR